MAGIFDLLKQLAASGAGLAGGMPELPPGGMTTNGRAGPHAASGAYASPSARPPALQEPQGWQRSPGSPLRERAERFQDMMDNDAQRYPDRFLEGFRRQLDQERHDQEQELRRMMNQYRGWDI
jgi:hypothetical protein